MRAACYVLEFEHLFQSQKPHIDMKTSHTEGTFPF